jgi:TRAP-type transport system small permease protein
MQAVPRSDRSGGKPRASSPLLLLEVLGERLSWVAIWGIVVLVFFQVVFRYVLNIGLSWPDEVARYLHILVVFLCLGTVTRGSRHIRIDVLSRHFAGPADSVFRLFVLFFTSVVLTAGATGIIIRIGHVRTPAAGMPIFLFFLPALLGFAMVALDCVRKLFAPGFGEPTDADAAEPADIT